MGQLQGAFALHAQAHEKAARLGRTHLAVHERRKPRGGHFSREILLAGQALQYGGEAGGLVILAQDGPREIAQQAQPLGREHGFGMKLHADPGPVIVAQGHDLAFRGPRGDREAGIGSVLVGADHQRVIAPHLHGIGQAAEQARAVVHDFRLFAVHDAGAHFHSGPGVQTQPLMPQADAEHRYARIDALEEFRAEARVGGMSRPRRDADHAQPRVRGRLQHGGVIVAQHARRMPQGVKSLHQIVGEGIIIIDEQKHILRPPPARPGA